MAGRGKRMFSKTSRPAVVTVQPRTHWGKENLPALKWGGDTVENGWSRDAVDCFRGDHAAAERLSAKRNGDSVRHPPHSAGSHHTCWYTTKTSHRHRSRSWNGVWHSSWNCRLKTDASRCCRYFRCSFYRQLRRRRSSAVLKRHNRAAQRCDAESQEHSFQHRATQQSSWDACQRASPR